MSEVDELRVRISDVEKSYVEVARLVSMREEHSKNVSDKVDQIYDLLIGTNNDPGLKIKVDRLEQSERYRNFLYIGVFGLVMNAVWDWIKGHHGG